MDPIRESVRALDEGSVDVLVHHRRASMPRDVPGDDNMVSDDDISFNTCSGSGAPDFTNYETMLHEAGHALGLSGFTWRRFWSQTPAHPTIPGSVMNYNSKVPKIHNEPDCSPHPFDMMAIEALYQTIVR